MPTKIRNIARATEKKPIIKAFDKNHAITEQRCRLASVSEHVHFRDHFSLLKTIVSNVLLSVISWTPTFLALTRTFPLIRCVIFYTEGHFSALRFFSSYWLKNKRKKEKGMERTMCIIIYLQIFILRLSLDILYI